jgi:hypothetical protein
MSQERSLSQPLFSESFHALGQFTEQVTLSIAVRFGFD